MQPLSVTILLADIIIIIIVSIHLQNESRSKQSWQYFKPKYSGPALGFCVSLFCNLVFLFRADVIHKFVRLV